MIIPLLVLARPKTTCMGPKVCLPDGDWEIETDIEDSEIDIISLDPPFKVLCNTGVRFPSSKALHVIILKPGTETSISVYAKQCQ